MAKVERLEDESLKDFNKRKADFIEATRAKRTRDRVRIKKG